jgi:hypothetical protein
VSALKQVLEVKLKQHADGVSRRAKFGMYRELFVLIDIYISCSEDPVSRSDEVYGQLADGLWLCWANTGNKMALAACIEVDTELLGIRPPGHPKRAMSCVSLALSLENHFNHTGNHALLDLAITLGKEALGLCPPGHGDRPKWCTNLAVTLSRRFDQTGDDALLDEAIDLGHEALNINADYTLRAKLCENLSVSLLKRFKRTGEYALMDEAITLQRRVMALRANDRPVEAFPLAMSMGNLSGSLNILYL